VRPWGPRRGGGTERLQDPQARRNRGGRDAVARTGVSIEDAEHGSLVVTGTPAELAALRRLGFTVTALPGAGTPSGPVTDGFPSADAGYHDYAELSSTIDAAVAAFPALARKSSIGTSYEGRQLWNVKISDNVGTDENEPEVLFTCGQHAREHLTIEMCLYLINELTTRYASDAQIRALVDSRELVLWRTATPAATPRPG
jgi:carboxypeptidase T